MPSTPTAGEASAALSVADALAIEQVSRWHPEVLCGHDKLDRAVRWAHVAEAADIGAMLSGDELLMTTGVLLKDDEAAQRRYIEQLIAADVSALVLGLGRAFNDVPPVLLQAARAAQLPLIVIRRPVPFVQMTEAIQRRLLDARSSAAVASEHLRDRILPIVLQGTTLQGLTDALASTLECAIIVESLTGSVLAASGERVDDLLRDWTRLSAEAPSGHTDETLRYPSGAVSMALSTRGHRWGRLVLLGTRGPESHGAMLAARSAEALELQHLLDEPESSPEFEQADALIGHLIAGSLSADRMRVLARVSGLPIGSRTLVPMMIGVTRGSAKAPESSPTAAAAAELSLKVRSVIDAVRADRRIPGLVGLLRNHRVPVVLSVSSKNDARRALTGFAEAVHERLHRDGLQVSLASGPECTKVEELTAGFAEAAHVADAFERDPQGPRILRPEDIRLRGLLRLLAGNDDVQTFVSRQLGPLLGRPELLSVLSTYLATSMNKVATAQLSHLSRPSLYRRLDQITGLLHVDLDDMEQVSALYVALLAYNARPTAAPDQR